MSASRRNASTPVKPVAVTPRRPGTSRREGAAPTGTAMGFGPHLIFDGHRCPASRLVHLDRIYEFLEALPERIGMTRIMPPYVFRHAGHGASAGGISGFVLIAESHIGIHTFPDRNFVNADIFSCETFDVQTVLAELKASFAPARMEWKLLDRGREFPKSVGQSRAAAAQERWQVARTLGLEVSR
jgi:S-adenosylmethionine decarboxylase